MPMRSQTYESGGPEGRVRGNAYQVLEKYLALARDANSAGDRIAAENYLQHAEHYYRMINASGDQSGRHRMQPASEGNGADQSAPQRNGDGSREVAAEPAEKAATDGTDR
jgi:hypothetical protein